MIDLPDWVGRWAVILTVLTLVVTGAIWGARLQTRAMGERPPNEIRTPEVILGCAWMCAAAVVLFGTAGLAGNVLSRGIGQYGPWASVVGFFGVVGALMFVETRTRVRYSRTGLTWRGQLTGWRSADWDEVIEIALRRGRDSLVFKLHRERRFSVSLHSDGVDDLLKTAGEAGVPGANRILKDDWDD